MITIAILVAIQVKAQVEYVGIPEILTDSILSEKVITTFSLEYLEVTPPKEDSVGRHYLGPSRFLSINPLSQIDFIEKGGMKCGVFKIQSLGAKAIRVLFDKFDLSSGTKIYFKDKDRIYGAYGAFNITNSKEKRFGSPILNGDECIVEIDIPIVEFENSQIHINQIGHFYEEKNSFFTAAKASSSDWDCNIDVNCPEGDSWCNQIRSVARFTFVTGKCDDYQHYTCSGAIVNNYKNDFTPYFLTAQHCTECDIDWINTIFHFNYQRPSCKDGYGIDYWTVTGAELLKSCDKADADIALLKINEKIPLQYNIYFSGYETKPHYIVDREDVTAIYHNGGDYKKITMGHIQDAVFPKWRIVFDNGALAGGSSGCPLFLNSNKKVIGLCSGGIVYDCDAGIEPSLYFGKLRYCWHKAGVQDYLGGGVATEELDGIDPVRACQTNIDLDGYFHDARLYRSVKHNILIQAEKNINVSNSNSSFFTPSSLYPFENSNYTLTAEERIFFSGSNVTRVGLGAQLRCQIKPCTASEEECGFNYFGKKAPTATDKGKEIATNEIFVFPNPANNSITISAPVLRDFTIVDIMERIVYSHHQTDSDNIIINTENLPTGIYTLRVNHSDFIHTQKIIIQH